MFVAASVGSSLLFATLSLLSTFRNTACLYSWAGRKAGLSPIWTDIVATPVLVSCCPAMWSLILRLLPAE